MSDYLAFKDQARLDSGDPATHAILIGIGKYPHLDGGTRDLTTLDGGLTAGPYRGNWRAIHTCT